MASHRLTSDTPSGQFACVPADWTTTPLNTSSTPLISLHALAIDTETTGLDATTARVIEIAAIRVSGLEIEGEPALEQLLRPDVPVPESASHIHGLTSDDLAACPRFADIAPALRDLMQEVVVIGHNVGYDLAILDREYARAALPWKRPHFLDVRALARLAAPDIANYDLATLSSWLGIDIEGRHRALPDARCAAQIFVRLVPLLRAKGIGTLSEAEYATRHLPGEERLHRAGAWMSPVESAPAGAAAALAAIDSYPYQHRVCDLPLHPPVFVQPTAATSEAAMALLDAPNAIVIVGSPSEGRGLLTAETLLRAQGEQPSRGPTLDTLPLPSLATVNLDDHLYRAFGRLQRANAQHLAVVNGSGEIVGTLSAADLLRHRVTSALVLGDEIDAARSVAELGRAWCKIPSVVSSLLRETIEPPKIARIVGSEIRSLTARAASMAQARMRDAGKGAPPCAYAVMVLGSAGRGDSLLSADQDNAIVFAAGEAGGPEDAWFAELGAHIADILNEVGVPYCPGGVMAKNPGCRHSERDWRQVIADWVANARIEDLLAADIFFDGVPVHGDIKLAQGVFDFAFSAAQSAPRFIAALASFAKDWQPPIGILGRLILEGDGRLDLKRNGLLPAATAARTFALKYGIRPTSTVARLAEAKAQSLADTDIIDRASTAYAAIMREVLAQQVRDAHAGIRLSARVQVSSMPMSKKTQLKSAMQAVSELVGLTLNL